MYIKMTYNNDNEPFVIDIPETRNSAVLNLEVEGTSGRSRKTALMDYVINLEMAFRELINQHETNISEIEIQDIEFGNIKKTSNDINFLTESGKLAVDSKYNMILFHIYNTNICEKSYFTRNDGTDRATDMYFMENKINPISVDSNLGINKNKLRTLILIAQQNLKGYKVKIDAETNAVKYYYHGVEIKDLNDIKQNDVFVFFKLFEVLLYRLDHKGVYIIDASVFSKEVLSAIIQLINIIYKFQCRVFLYNVPNSFKPFLENELKVKTVVLPNQKLSKEVKEKLKLKQKQ